MSGQNVNLVAVGDVRFLRDDSVRMFDLNKHVIKAADIVFAQLEAPFSDRGSPQVGRGAPRCCPTKYASVLPEAGFNVISFASNHCMDYGVEAFSDTLDVLRENRVNVIGVGQNLAEARKPLIMDVRGTRVAFLAYCSVLLYGYWATANRPGCAPIRARTFYEPIQFWYQPGTPVDIFTAAYPEDLSAMREDVKQARALADVVVVSQHAGVVFVHAVIATYQKEIAYAAIDAGADLVLQHHSHMLKGIEVYKEKAVFYGLGDFAFQGGPSGIDKDWMTQGEKVYGTAFGTKPEPGWELHPYPPIERKTMLVKCLIANKRIQRVSFLPCLLNQKIQAEILSPQDKRGQEIFQYVVDISQDQKLNVALSWDKDEVLVWPK